jgi:hypothetical protein
MVEYKSRKKMSMPRENDQVEDLALVGLWGAKIPSLTTPIFAICFEASPALTTSR